MNKSVTLIELVVVIIIIGVLAAVALPMFPKAMESTRAKEAVSGLRQIRTAERIYRGQEGTYFYSSGAGGDVEINEINNALNLRLDVRNERNWNYKVETGATPGDTFIATATRISGGSDYQGKIITLNENGPPFGGDFPHIPGQ